MHKWRRFLPKRTVVDTHDDLPLSTVRDSGMELDERIGILKARAEQASTEQKIERLRNLLLAQTPRAAKAQIQMDTHKHGYHNREKRLYELIDFNDTFVNLALATPPEELPGFAERLKNDMTQFCRRLNTPMFSDEQYDAIVRGLGREIAVYRAAIQTGFEARMTSRTEDAFGIDMVITQPGTKKVLNIDCKTPSAFRHRLEDMLKHGRIDEDQLLQADKDGYITVFQHRNQESVPVTTLAVLPDLVGDIHDFNLDYPEQLADLLNTIFVTVE